MPPDTYYYTTSQNSALTDMLRDSKTLQNQKKKKSAAQTNSFVTKQIREPTDRDLTLDFILNSTQNPFQSLDI